MLLRSQILGIEVPRYLKQKDKSSCGPVAVINYWKFRDLKARYSDIKILRRLLGTTNKGTSVKILAAFLHSRWRKAKKMTCPAIVYCDNHFWLCAYECNGGYIGINYGSTYCFVSNRKMKSILKKGEILRLK